MDESLMKIGELAAMFHITTKAIRIYDRKGIIKPARVDTATGYRYYSPDQVQRLNILLELKIMGFSLDEIRRILDGELTKADFINSLAKKKAAWRDIIAVAEDKIFALDEICVRIEESVKAEALHQMTEDERVYILSKLVCIQDTTGHDVLSQVLWL